MSMMELQRSIPELQGVSSKAIMEFIEEAEKIRTADMNQDFHSFMLLRHGYVIAEGWWEPYLSKSPHVLFSLSKSFTSTAIGFAVQEGLLTVEDSVVSYFKEECPQPGELLKKMKIKHLLSMNTGHVIDTTDTMTTREDGNWVAGFFQVPVEKEPGSHFLYNTGATYMLSVILQKLTGSKLIDYLTPRLFAPLGITGASWDECPRGYNTGGFGLRVKTEDIAKLGQFYLKQGKLDEHTLLSPDWIAAATGVQSDNSVNGNGDWGQGYGYQFWRCRHNAYRGDGAFGQYCVVMPEYDAVLAITGGMKDLQKPLEIVWDKLLPGFFEGTLEESLEYEELKNKLASLKLLLPQGSEHSPWEKILDGRHYQMETNPFDISEVSFQFTIDQFILSVKAGGEVLKYPVGIGKWQPGTFQFEGKAEPIVFTGSWEKDEVLLIQGRLTEMPFAISLRFEFGEEKLMLEQRLNVGFEEQAPIITNGTIIN